MADKKQAKMKAQAKKTPSAKQDMKSVKKFGATMKAMAPKDK